MSFLIAIMISAIVIGAVATSMMYYVDIGQVGIVYDITTGGISPIPHVGPQWFFKLPWQYVKTVFIKTDSVDMFTDYDATGKPIKSGTFAALDVPTTEGLVLHMDVTVRWHLTSSSIITIVQNFPGLDYADKVIIPGIREVVRDTTGKNSALDLYGPQRDLISSKIRDTLRDRLDKDPVIPHAIVLEDFYMRQVFLPVDFAKSVEAKQVAQQDLEKANFQRQTVLVQANATAQSAVIQASGIAQAVKIVATQFHSMTNQELQAYLTLKYIEALQAGLVQGNKVIILLPTSNGNIILSLPNDLTTGK